MTDGSRGAEVLEVTGGVGGLEATYAAVRQLAATYDDAGDLLRDWAGTGRRTLADHDLLESGLLSPATFLLAEAAVLAATTGPDGLLVRSLGWELDAIAIRAAVAALEQADECVHDTFEVLDYAVCRALGTGALLGSPPLVAGVAVAAHDPSVLTEHPGIVEHLVNGGGGLVDAVTGGPFAAPLHPTTEDGAATIAGLYAVGIPHVTAVDVTVPGGSTQPTSVEDLIEHAGEVAALSPTPGSPLNGTIEVQTITRPDGSVSHVVYLPGTDDLTTLPWTQDDDVRDMGTNIQLVAGQLDAYQQGILQAMHDAGIGPEDPVCLVGHSQGGMEAAAILASDQHGFHVTNAVTAGSPTAQVDGFPAGSHVLSLEQHGDVVTHLDGEPNPDSVEQTTVLFDAGPDGGVLAHHGYHVYSQGAAAADASHHPSVVANVESLHEHGFLGSSGDGANGASVTSQVFQITRDPR